MSVQRIDSSLLNFTSAIANGDSVACNKTGGWYRDGWLMSIVRWFTGTAARDTNVVEAVQRVFDEIEKKPLVYNGRKTLDATDQPYLALAAGRVVIERYSGSKNAKLNAAINEVANRIIALEYRKAGADDYKSVEEASAFDPLSNLTTQAQKWMDQQLVFDKTKVDDKQKAALQRACRYPKFAEQISRDSITRGKFFKWALRDGLDVDIFVQFPAVRKRLSSAFLDKRLGRLGQEHLKMTKTGSKDVTLSFEGKQVSILDENSSVTLSKGYQMTVKAAFDVFRNKNKDVGNLEWTKDGITNWHVFKHGPWNPSSEKYESISFDKKDWWKQLPRFESISSEELQKRFGRTLKPGEHGMAAKGSRTTPDLNSLDAHGWLEVFIPNDSGTYDVLPIGKYATRFPASWKEYIGIAAATEPAGLQYPEENVYRTSRQHAGLLKGLDSRQFDLLMENLGSDMKKAHNKGLVFQALGNNCAAWVQTVFQRVLGDKTPKLYDIVYHETELAGPASYVFAPFKAIPNVPVKDFFLKGLFRLFGAAKGIQVQGDDGKSKFMSLSNSEFWKSGPNAETHNPAILVDRVLKGHFATSN
ncbi:hypothetical protein SCG7086_CI_00040 [Chlamydiales bacterium SCGC AG-110-P3]|nr:hypothetical protein SCG7086_CI_00040 [Chlamydiales bacterium SCGC AG-110-P3]